MKNKDSILAVPGLFFIFTSILVYLGIVNSWFGELRPGIMLFCEHARDGFIKQPANTWSNLSFTVAGLMAARFAYSHRAEPVNLMSSTLLYPILISLAYIGVGAGSFAMHSTNAPWGGFFDLFGMFMISSFFFCYALKRCFKLSDNMFLFLYGFSVSFCTYVLKSPLNDLGLMFMGAELLFGSQLFFAIVLELYLMYSRKIQIRASLWWFSQLVLAAAFLIWNLSRTQDSIWCNPNSLFQGHAFWHILNAVGVYLMFRYYYSEKTRIA